MELAKLEAWNMELDGVEHRLISVTRQHLLLKYCSAADKNQMRPITHLCGNRKFQAAVGEKKSQSHLLTVS